MQKDAEFDLTIKSDSPDHFLLYASGFQTDYELSKIPKNLAVYEIGPEESRNGTINILWKSDKNTNFAVIIKASNSPLVY